MAATFRPFLDSSATLPAADAALSGCWKLGAGRAVSLRPTEAGQLRIAHGRVWATFDGAADSPLGDWFLEAGATLAVRPGQRIVIEPFGTHADAPAYFSWVPGTESAPSAAAARWQRAVDQPASDLRLALGSAGFALGNAAGALARLVVGVFVGVGGFAIDLIASRDRVAGTLRAFNADCSASRAHGAMS